MIMSDPADVQLSSMAGMANTTRAMIPRKTFLSLFVNTYYTGKLIRVGILRQTMDIAPIFGISCLMYFVAYLVTKVFFNPYAQVFIGGLVATILYVGVAIALKRDELNDLKYMLKRKN
jgi:hypothetical protein